MTSIVLMKTRVFFFLFTILIVGLCNGQIHILDSITKTAIPFVAIENIKTKEGFYSSENGEADLDKFKNDEVRISCLGYKSIIIQSKPLTRGDTVFLSPQAQMLKGVSVYGKTAIIEEIGYLKKKKY